VKQQSFKFLFVHLKPEEQIGLHAHKDWELSYVASGAGMRLIGEYSESFRPGELFLCAAGGCGDQDGLRCGDRHPE